MRPRFRTRIGFFLDSVPFMRSQSRSETDRRDPRYAKAESLKFFFCCCFSFISSLLYRSRIARRFKQQQRQRRRRQRKQLPWFGSLFTSVSIRFVYGIAAKRKNVRPNDVRAERNVCLCVRSLHQDRWQYRWNWYVDTIIVQFYGINNEHAMPVNWWCCWMISRSPLKCGNRKSNCMNENTCSIAVWVGHATKHDLPVY